MKTTKRLSGKSGKVERYCETCKRVEFEGFVGDKWRVRRLFTAPTGKISCQACERQRQWELEEEKRRRERIQDLTRQIEGHKDAITRNTIEMKKITLANRSN